MIVGVCVYTLCDFAYDSELRTCMKMECVMYLHVLTKNRGKWQTCFHSSYERSIVGLQMTCGHPYGLCQLASTIPAHSLHNVKNTKP